MGKLNVRAYFVVLGFALLLTLFIAIGLAANWGIFRQPITEQVFNEDAVNQAALEPGGTGLAGIDLFMRILPPSSIEEKRELKIGFDGAAAYLRDPDEQFIEFCLEDLGFLYQPESNDSEYISFLDEPLCATPDPAFFFEEYELGSLNTDQIYEINLLPGSDSTASFSSPSEISMNFWYPFDSFEVHAYMIAVYSLRDADGRRSESTIQPLVAWDVQTSGTRIWDLRTSFTSHVQERASDDLPVGTYEELRIVFERPLLYRVTFPFFMAMMVLLIALVPLLADRDTLVDISAAMLFGIFGLKGILGPGDQMGRTLLDIGLIALYVVLAFAAGLFFLNRILEKRAAHRAAPDESMEH